METLSVDDVRKIVHLLWQVAALKGDLAGIRRFLMEGMARIVQACSWHWIHSKLDEGNKVPAPFAVLEGGWSDDAQRLKFTEGLVSPVAQFATVALWRGLEVHRTRRRIDVIPDYRWYPSDLVLRFWAPAGVGDFLSSDYPLENEALSSLRFYRRIGAPSFSPRDACIVHLIAEEVDWLHRGSRDIPASQHMNRLSMRQRQVILQLLNGDSVKQIARKLSLSAYTVNDHLKTIYRRFEVCGRGELLAKFLAGGAEQAPSCVDSRSGLVASQARL